MADDAYSRALRLLGQRAHLRAELRRKLLQRGFDGDEVEAALIRCTEQGYLDDTRTAAALASEGQQRRGWGRAKVKAELVRRGASGASIEAALATTSDEAELARARELAARWRRTHPPAQRGTPAATAQNAALGSASSAAQNAALGSPSSAAQNAALARHLDRKGFSRRAIFAALSEAGAATELDLEALDESATDPAD